MSRPCGSRSPAAARAGSTSRSCSSGSTRRTRSSSTSATRPTTRSASASCSRTRRWPRSRRPTRETYAEITRRFARWSDIDVHYRGEVVTCGGHGFSALGRKRAARDPAARAPPSSASSCASAPRSAPSSTGDLVVAADGVNSTLRGRYADAFQPSLDRAPRDVRLARHRRSCSTRSRSSSPRPSTASSRSTRYPYSDR